MIAAVLLLFRIQQVACGRKSAEVPMLAQRHRPRTLWLELSARSSSIRPVGRNHHTGTCIGRLRCHNGTTPVPLAFVMHAAKTIEHVNYYSKE